MSNTFINGKKIKLFAAAVKNTAPYLEASKSYFAGDIEGRKNGQTYYTYISDPGVATSGVDITSDDRSNVQKQVAVTLRNMKQGVDLTTLNRTVDIESFADEVAKPLGQTIGASVQKEVVERTILTADGAIVATSAAFKTLGSLAAKLRGVKAAGKITGWFHPEDASDIIASGLGVFQAPTEYAKMSFGDASVGRFASTDWNEIPEIPAYTMGTFIPSSATTVTGTLTADGLTSIGLSDAGLTTASTIKVGTIINFAGVKTLTLNNMVTQEQYSAIVTADATGTAGAITVTVNPIYFAKGAAKNVSVTSLVAGTKCVASGQVAGSTYRVIQARDNDALAFDTYKFAALPSAEEMSESVGKFKIEGCAIGNVLTRDSVYRFDFPYAAEMVQSKLNRIAFVLVS